MSAVPPIGPTPQPPAGGQDNLMARWASLLAEMSALHAQLEYTRLMLRLGAWHDADR